MPTQTLVDPATIRAYQQTEYRVFDDPDFSLWIEQTSQPLLDLYRRYDVECAGFITACNPRGEPLDARSNAARQKLLEAELNARGLRFLRGLGQPARGDWIAEPSFLVPGLTLEYARLIGRRFEQNAIVCCGKDAVPQLVLLR
jgi:hypothetical protein